MDKAEAKIALLEIENAEQASTIEQQGRIIRHLEAQFGEAMACKQQVIQELGADRGGTAGQHRGVASQARRSQPLRTKGRAGRFAYLEKK